MKGKTQRKITFQWTHIDGNEELASLLSHLRHKQVTDAVQDSSLCGAAVPFTQQRQ